MSHVPLFRGTISPVLTPICRVILTRVLSHTHASAWSSSNSPDFRVVHESDYHLRPQAEARHEQYGTEKATEQHVLWPQRLRTELHVFPYIPIRSFSAGAKVVKGVLQHAGESILFVVCGHYDAECLARRVPRYRKQLPVRSLPGSAAVHRNHSGARDRERGAKERPAETTVLFRSHEHEAPQVAGARGTRC